MSRLTDSQSIALSAAAARGDGCAVAPAKMNKAAASKVGASLVARKLMREVKAKSGMPVWRTDGDRSFSLIITSAGRKAIGVDDGEPIKARNAASSAKRSKPSPASAGKSRLESALTGTACAPTPPPRMGSKQALLVEMLAETSGATLDALIDATGWLPHTTRAALTGLRKRGFSIERKREGGASVYRIVGGSASAAAAA